VRGRGIAGECRCFLSCCSLGDVAADIINRITDHPPQLSTPFPTNPGTDLTGTVTVTVTAQRPCQEALEDGHAHVHVLLELIHGTCSKGRDPRSAGQQVG